jgi:hypothetical protein
MVADKPEPEDSEFYSEQETIRRRDAALKRMLETPPQPQKKSEPKKKIGSE